MKRGWEVKRLEEIIDSNVIGLVKNSGEQGANKKYKYVKMNNITSSNEFDFSNFVCVDASSEEAEKYNLKDEDFLFNTRNSKELVGKTCVYRDINKDTVLFNNNIMRIRFIKMINPYFINYQFTTKPVQEKLNSMKSGTTNVSAIYYKNLQHLSLFIPPLPEQQRIVSVLDEAFASIAQAKSNAERNLVNARELFESVTQEIFSSFHDGWEEKSLEELGQITSSKRIYKNEYVKEGVPFYRIKEVKELANNKDISIELFISNKRYQEIKESFGVPAEGDLLMTAVGTIGEIYVVKKDDEFYFKDGNVLWFKDFKSIDPYFLKFALSAFVEKIRRLSAGAAYSALTIEKIEKHKVFVPSLAEQRAIVGRLEALSAETGRLEEIYQSKVEALEELKKSVLQKAFEGELTGMVAA